MDCSRGGRRLEDCSEECGEDRGETEEQIGPIAETRTYVHARARALNSALSDLSSSSGVCSKFWDSE